jgi:hypothetical protein
VAGVPLTVEVDGSTIGYSAVLRQNGRICATASRQKTKTELNYGSFDNEWGALVFGVDAFRFWLAGRTDTLVDTDLKGLTENDLDVHAHEDRTGRRARWVDALSHFPHTLRWRPREQMVVSDALAKSPAFRAPVLALREEAAGEARARLQSAMVASGRGGKAARGELKRKENALARAKMEEAQRARVDQQRVEMASRLEKRLREREQREQCERREKEQREKEQREKEQREQREKDGLNHKDLKTEGEKERNGAPATAWTITKAARRAEKRIRRRERRRAKKRAESTKARASALKSVEIEETARTDSARASNETTTHVASLVAGAAQRPDVKEVREQQMRDPQLKALIDFIEGKTPNVTLVEMTRLAAQAQHLAMRDGVLGHIERPTKKSIQDEHKWMMVVPDVDGERRRWFDRAHSQDGGHMRHGQVYARLLNWVYWDGMWSDALAWCKECITCDLFAQGESLQAKLQPTTTASLKGQRRVHVDLAGPFQPDEFGNTYYFIAVDREDNWSTARPIGDATASETTRALCHITADSGVMEIITIDKGSNFTAKHAQDYYKAVGVKPEEAPSESPWVNGAAEATVKIVKAICEKLVEERRTMWSKLDWLINLVMRSRTVGGYHLSAFEARFARKMRTPASFNLPFDDVQAPEFKDLARIKKILEERRDEVAEKMKKKYDAEVKESKFGVGDLVWHVPRRQRSGMEPKKSGPFKIEEILGKATVKIGKVDEGPDLGQRPKVQSIWNLEVYKHAKIYRQKELIVMKIIGHRGKGRGRRYQVQWEDGTDSWEARKQLVDKETDGTETVNAELVAYLDRNPSLSRKV